MVLSIRHNKRRLSPRGKPFHRRTRPRSASWSVSSPDVKGTKRKLDGGIYLIQPSEIVFSAERASVHPENATPQLDGETVPFKSIQLRKRSLSFADYLAEDAKSVGSGDGEPVPKDILVDSMYNFLFSMDSPQQVSVEHVVVEMLNLGTREEEERRIKHALFSAFLKEDVEYSLIPNGASWFERTQLISFLLAYTIEEVGLRRNEWVELLNDDDVVAQEIPEFLLLKTIVKKYPKLRRFLLQIIHTSIAEYVTTNVEFTSSSSEKDLVAAPFVILNCLAHDVLSICRKHSVGAKAMREETQVASRLFLGTLSKARKLLPLGLGANIATAQLNSIIVQLIKMNPEVVSNCIIARMTRSWPDNGSITSLLYLDILDTFLHLCPVDIIVGTALHTNIFNCLNDQLFSSNSQYVRRAIQILGAPHVILNLIAQYEPIRKSTTTCLFGTSRSHWCETIRELTEELFDALLDFA
uniref:Uncharacterized protein n=1 Tax=Mucochytrium quahogii TaxID=96639 RepID=A0A7S2W932_9STRA|mmetsp:Transcript_7545/g.12163  ORF Transcript_7545/g.12163 Transcript_7545/m.12163 type:complete len:468 (+) Transcript_7545:305-1708(+)|eukprot:CAMPEP_0203749640 /NCGR_PEP_ID=MMETSP0098-20131031/4122_1 /ASSEMBLY_ACC=CAM_ASM_000208 /TAXON_ID=96639 /ORGANISM=" , Strain NY0313808BC1" /LENGTH=467 /DNA_ID=CAMNT_0050638727 /DNA_START=252 /DNA_END=1655 /DNA_ORIENTATION=+